MSPIQRLLEEALQMSAKERALIAERLLASLEAAPAVDKKVELAWQKEIKKRLSEVRDKKVKFIPWEEVYSRLKGKTSAR